MNKKVSIYFIVFGLTALILTSIFGILSSLYYVYPDLFGNDLPFNKLRPLHVSSAVSWIILTAVGGIYYYTNHYKRDTRLVPVHFILYLLTGIGIYISFLLYQFGGREYFSFSPYFIIPILLGWALFGITYFRRIRGTSKKLPVYKWMWGTGIVFMILHISEAHLWLFPYFRENFIKDLSVQWKSYGSFVGSWNMLVYGTAIYLMTKLKGDESLAFTRKSFFFFFLGLTNLMFGWAHHTYIVPNAPWIRYLAYIISMTEWVVLLSIIRDWKKSFPAFKRNLNTAYKFIISSEYWILINLVFALLISIPALNYFTHGTHFTVAHSMGTTIGINTSILFASVSYIASKESSKLNLKSRWVIAYNICLFFFWVVLLSMGYFKSQWVNSHETLQHGSMMNNMNTFHIVFVVSGILLGLVLISIAAYFAIKLLKSTPKNTN
jgi:nitric oxide reductase subunit B